uniref:MFS domain-containing protein n=3 Tax=Caenorhabditis japonica TaxID=281687 RepID=A0A8R1HXV7_CAEJA
MSVKWPVISGFVIAAVAQTWYGILGIFTSDAKWFMLAARIVTGLGVGNIAALRVYGATASTPKDRMKAISYGTGGYVLGISFGPVLSAFFTPLGETGWKMGSIYFNMFTAVAFVMTFVCLAACFVVHFFFKENYVGIMDENETDSNVVVPNYDLWGALICIYLFMIVNIIATNIEVMSTPLTTVLYDWKDSQSILYNGIALCCSCIVSVALNVILGSTKLGKLDKRIQMLIGIVFFLLYQVFMYPWSFYSGPLDYIPAGEDTDLAGGCYQTYAWCKWTTRVPLPIYLVCFIVFFGIAFPFVESPSAALYSEILGPRKQGTMQGIFSLGGSLAPVIGSLTSTALFQATGFRFVMVYQAGILVIGAALILVFYKRLVPLKLKSIKKT